MENKNKNKGKNNPVIPILQTIFILTIICLQIKVCIVYWYGTTDYIKYFNAYIGLIKVGVIIHIVYKMQNTAYKLFWMVFIALCQIPGLLCYLAFGSLEVPKNVMAKINKENLEMKKHLKIDEKIYGELKDLDKQKYYQARLISKTTDMPLYKNSAVEFLDSGEKYFENMIQDISKGEKYIFLEWFSIIEGAMWDKLYSVLKQKNSEGVKVYLIYDGMIPMEKRPKDLINNLEQAGIKYQIFNPISINLNSYLNHRNHKKIVVIDGIVAYTGGINIGDQYVNLYAKHGHWKDNGVKISGEAVKNYIALFVNTWNLSANNNKLEYNQYITKETINENIGQGYVLPFNDGPDNKNNPATNVYMQMINMAKDYVYIMTPYIALDNEFIGCLINSARCGVDVRIILPHIPDKKIVHSVTHSFYSILLEAGVKIYEYGPGFIHSKTIVVDDELAIVGTINLDYRALYYHYECANWMYKTGIEKAVKEEFLTTQNKCIEMELNEWKKKRGFKNHLDKVLITIAPLI